MHRRRGMSLAEVLLAVVLFVTVSYALTGVWVTHAKSVEKSQRLLAATHIAELHLTEQMGLGFKAAACYGLDKIARSIDDVNTEEEYRWEVTVQDTSVQTPDLKHVKVRVDWTELGQPRSVEMVTSVYWQG